MSNKQTHDCYNTSTRAICNMSMIQCMPVGGREQLMAQSVEVCLEGPITVEMVCLSFSLSDCLSVFNVIRCFYVHSCNEIP